MLKNRKVLKANDFSIGKDQFLSSSLLFKMESKKIKKEKPFGIILQVYKPGEFNLGNTRGKKLFS